MYGYVIPHDDFFHAIDSRPGSPKTHTNRSFHFRRTFNKVVTNSERSDLTFWSGLMSDILTLPQEHGKCSVLCKPYSKIPHQSCPRVQTVRNLRPHHALPHLTIVRIPDVTKSHNDITPYRVVVRRPATDTQVLRYTPLDRSLSPIAAPNKTRVYCTIPPCPFYYHLDHPIGPTSTSSQQ